MLTGGSATTAIQDTGTGIIVYHITGRIETVAVDWEALYQL